MPLDSYTRADTVRQVHSGERGGAATKVAIIRSAFPTSQTDLWDAITSEARIPQWFLPIDGELRAGGQYQTEGNAGGRIEACEAPDSFAVTWEYAGQLSWLRVELARVEHAAELTLHHEAPVGDGEFWKQYGPGATGVGWELALLSLRAYVDAPAAFDPSEVQAWSESAAAHPFIQRVAQAWADAAIQDGDDPTAAKAAAIRTYAFYTGAEH